MFTGMSSNDDQGTDRRARIRSERDSDQHQIEQLAIGRGAPWLGVLVGVFVIAFIVYAITSR